jgi:hypothetical protein
MTNVVGEVAVDVYANDSRLEEGLRKARAQTEAFNKSAQKTTEATQELAFASKEADKAFRSLAKDFDPAAAAAIRYADQIKRINLLLNEQAISFQEASGYIDKARKQFEDAAKSQTTLGKFAEFAKGKVLALGVAAAAAAATGIYFMAKAAIDNASALKDLSARLGVGVEDLQKYQFIASKTNVEQSAMERGFEALNRTMAQAAAGAERPRRAFELLGVSLKDSEGNARGVSEVLPDLADRLALIEDKNQRAAVAQVLFGEAGAQMIKLLEGGSDKINELSEAAAELGLVLSEEQIDKLDKAGVKMEQLKKVLSARVAGVVAENTDAILTFADAFETLANGIGWAITKMNEFEAAVDRNVWDKAADGLQGLGARMLGMSPAALKGGTPSAATSDPKTAPKPTGETIDASEFLKRPTRTRRGRQPRDGTIQFENQMAQMQTQILRASMDLLGTAEARAVISNRILDIEGQRFQATVAQMVKEKRYTAGQAAQLRATFAELDAAKRRAIEIETQERLLREQTDKRIATLSNDSELLSLSLSMSRSREEALAIERKLLDLQHRMEMARLDAVIASETESEANKEIAKERKAFLDLLRNYQDDNLNQKYMTAVDAFIDRLTMSEAELADVMDRIRANRMAERVQRSAQFADDVGDAFANLGRDILSLQSPLDILRNFLLSLTQTFNEELLIRPLQEFARDRIGGPLAERATGAPAGPEGVWMRNLGNEAFNATPKVTAVGDAALIAATKLRQGFAVSTESVADALGGVGDEASGAASALSAQTQAATQFGNALSSVLSQPGGGAGGAGGLIGSLLGMAAGALGGGAGPSASLLGSVNQTMAANPGIFHDGGEVGPGGRNMGHNRKLGSREHWILAEEGERIIDRGNSDKFGSMLDSIAEGRMPMMRPMGLGARMQGNRTYVGPTVNTGPINVAGAGDERSARRSGRQVANEINRQIAHAARKGYGFND